MGSFELYVGGESVGSVTDISGPTISLAPAPEDSAEFVPHLRNAGQVEFEVNPWRVPSGLADLHLRQTRDITIVVDYRPAWWGRIKDQLTNRPIRTYVLVRSRAVVSRVTLHSAPDGMTIGANVTGPVEMDPPPMSRLEAVWDRVCGWFR